MFVDPDGEFAFLAPILIGAGIGAAWNGISYALNPGPNGFELGSFGKAVGIGALGGGLGGAAAIFAPAGVLPGMLYGASTGGLIGGSMSWLSGGDFQSGAIAGMIGGGIGGGIGGYQYAKNLGRNPWTGGLRKADPLLELNLTLDDVLPAQSRRMQMASPRFSLASDPVDDLAGVTIGPRIPTTADGIQLGFNSHRALKEAIGRAGDNMDWHHLVMQHRGNIDRFGASSIHNINNVVAIPRPIHHKITGFYNSIRPGLTRSTTLRVWQWQAQKSYSDQRQFGAWVLENFLQGRW
jgi:hypothetical protein